MIESSHTLSKLLLLYMLNKVDYPLSNSQISDLFLEKEYTSYFQLQQVLNEMLETDLISSENTKTTTYYRITENGIQTLGFFEKEISPDFRKDIEEFLTNNAYQLRSESAVISDYYRVSNDDYAAHCVVRENEGTLIELTLHFPTESSAREVCENWKKKNQEAYAALVDILM